MGACCTREQTQANELLNSVHYTTEEIINTGVDILSKPELKYEEIKLIKTPQEMQLDLIINGIQNLYEGKTKKISQIELYNLTIYFKDNYTKSEYLLFDMRRSSEQKEDYIKKMNHINYTYSQIKNISGAKKDKFRTFLDNKIIIFIISEKILKKDGKNKSTPKDIINTLFKINDNIKIYLLDSILSEKETPIIFIKLLSFLGEKSYEILPYILFYYRHVSTFYIDGYIFINFIDKNKTLFSFESLINELNKNNELSFENKFLKDMNITSMISIDNDDEANYENGAQPNKDQFEIKVKENQYKKTFYKNIYCSKNSTLKNKNKIKEICDWLRNEVSKGHSIYINIDNYEDRNEVDNDGTETNNNNHIKNNWIFVVIVFLTYIVKVNYIEIVNYLKEKINYIQNISEIIDFYLREIDFNEFFND